MTTLVLQARQPEAPALADLQTAHAVETEGLRVVRGERTVLDGLGCGSPPGW